MYRREREFKITLVVFVKVIVVNMEDQSRFGKTEKRNEKSSNHLVYEDDELPDRLVGYSLLLPPESSREYLFLWIELFF